MIMKTATTENKHTRRAGSSNRNIKLVCLIAAVLFAAMLDSSAAQPTNLPPVAVNDAFERNPNSKLRIKTKDLLANDTDPDGDKKLTINSVSTTSTAGWPVVLQGKNVIYNPPSGFTNSDSFSYVIEDKNGLMATGSVSITIRVDLAPSQNVAAREVLANGDSSIQFTGIPGVLYTIQYTDSPQTPHWHSLGQQLADATGRFEWVDAPPQGATGRIYRSTYP